MDLITPGNILADLLINNWTLDNDTRDRIFESPLPKSQRLSIAKRLVALKTVDNITLALRASATILIFLAAFSILNIDGGIALFPTGRLAIVTGTTLACTGLAFVVTSSILRWVRRKRYRNLLVELEEPKL